MVVLLRHVSAAETGLCELLPKKEHKGEVAKRPANKQLNKDRHREEEEV